MRRTQQSTALVSSKLNLSGGMSGQHFVEPEIQLVVAKLSHEGRQVNGASIVDARFIGTAASGAISTSRPVSAST